MLHGSSTAASSPSSKQLENPAVRKEEVSIPVSRSGGNSLKSINVREWYCRTTMSKEVDCHA